MKRCNQCRITGGFQSLTIIALGSCVMDEDCKEPSQVDVKSCKDPSGRVWIGLLVPKVEILTDSEPDNDTNEKCMCHDRGDCDPEAGTTGDVVARTGGENGCRSRCGRPIRPPVRAGSSSIDVPLPYSRPERPKELPFSLNESHSCEVCGKALQSRSALIRHLPRHALNYKPTKHGSKVLVKQDDGDRPAASTSRKRKLMTLNEKVGLLDMLAAGVSAAEVGRRFHINESTVRAIRKKEWEIRNSVSKGAPSSARVVTKVRDTVLERTERDVATWMEERTRRRLVVNGALICKKARELYGRYEKKLREDGASIKFFASNGWLHNFKIRFGIHNFRRALESSSAADADSVDQDPIISEPENMSDHQDLYPAQSTTNNFRSETSCSPEQKLGSNIWQRNGTSHLSDHLLDNNPKPIATTDKVVVEFVNGGRVLPPRIYLEEEALVNIFRLKKALADEVLAADPLPARSLAFHSGLEALMLPYRELCNDETGEAMVALTADRFQPLAYNSLCRSPSKSESCSSSHPSFSPLSSRAASPDVNSK